MVIAFFMPVFFATAGLSADLTILTDPTLLLFTVGLIAIASIGKFGGAFVGGKLAGLTFFESLALGAGMNARGSTEVIVATIGLSMGALSQNLFTMIVTMAVITTLAMPPTLRWALSKVPMRKDERQRLEREAMEAKGFVPKLERLLLIVDESNNAKFATRIAGLIAGGSAMPTTVIHIKNDKKTSRAAAQVAEQTAEEFGMTVKEFAEQVKRVQRPEEKTDARLDVTTIVKKAPKPEAVAKEAEKGYSLMIVGLEKTVAWRNEFHEDITKLATGFEGPLAVVDARDNLLEEPLKAKFNILVPVNGNEYSRRAAEIAIAIARAGHAPLTALYAAPGGRKRSRGYEDAVLKDISKLAEAYDTEIRTAVRADIAAEEAILKELSRKEYNLVVVGAGRRPGRKLFFGDTAAALLEKSARSLLFVAS
jgi:K+:H+ antiporter